MTLEEEMKLWEERANDKVSKLIDFAYKETKDIIYSYTDEFGIEHNPIKSISAMYALDGNAKYSIRELKNILHNYDVIKTIICIEIYFKIIIVNFALFARISTHKF